MLITKLPFELRLIVSRKFGDSDSWRFDELPKLIEEEDQARERSLVRTLQTERQQREQQQRPLCSHTLMHLSVVSVSRTTLRRTVKQLMELICVAKFSENWVDVKFA